MRAITPGGLLLSLLIATPVLAHETLVVTERPDHETTLARAPGADSLGDLIIFHNSIFDAKNRTRIGRDQGYCIRIILGQSYQCTWTLMLKDGQINVQGPYDDKGNSTLTITGGSGKYIGARGSMELIPLDAKHSAYTFRYNLL